MSDLGAAENFIVDPVEAEQNRRHSLRNTRKRQEDKKTASKPGDKLETPILAARTT